LQDDRGTGLDWHISGSSTHTEDKTKPSEAVYHLFRELNDHLRSTEQKHLQVSIACVSATALALSFLVSERVKARQWEPVLHSWSRALAYLVLVLAGCATMFAQHVYRGWKKDYLLACKKLVYDWPIPNNERVNWMRTDRGPYEHGDRSFFRLAGDNVLYWFVLIITSSLAVLLFLSVTKLIKDLRIAGPAVALGSIAYLVVFFYITAGGVRRKEVIENDWDEFRRLRRMEAGLEP